VKERQAAGQGGRGVKERQAAGQSGRGVKERQTAGQSGRSVKERRTAGQSGRSVKKGQFSGKAERNEELRQDYAVYHLSVRERFQYLGLYLFLDAGISYLFFSSGIAFVILLPGVFLFFEERKRTLQKKRAQEMKRQFMDGMQMVTASLQAGYSMENALTEALKELKKVYEPDAFIIREFRMMEAQLAMNRNLETLFVDFGRRCAIDDIQSFAEVFLTAKRSGGDLIAVIQNTVFCIRQKQETLQEIETCLAGKVMEQNIMSLIPLLILAYVKFTSPEFLEVMYSGIIGRVVMVLCFLVYVLAYFWGRKIVRIEV
jgi:tight adherence protein B